MKSWLWLYRFFISCLLASLVSVYLSIRYSNKKMSLNPRKYQTNRDVQYICRVDYIYLSRYQSVTDVGLFSFYKNLRKDRRTSDFSVPLRFEIRDNQNSWAHYSSNSKDYSDVCYTTRTMIKEILRKHEHLFEKNSLGFYGLKNNAGSSLVLTEGDEFALETLGSLIIFAASEDFYTEIGFSEELLSALLRPNVDILNEHYQKSAWAKSTIQSYERQLYGYGSCFTRRGEKYRAEKAYYGIREGEIIRLLDDLTSPHEKDPYFWLIRGRNMILSDKISSFSEWTPRSLNEKFTASQPFSKYDWIEHGLELQYSNYWEINSLKNFIKSLSRQKAFEFYKKLTGYEKFPYGGAVRGVRIHFEYGHQLTRDNNQEFALVFNCPYKITSDQMEEFVRSN